MKARCHVRAVAVALVLAVGSFAGCGDGGDGQGAMEPTPSSTATPTVPSAAELSGAYDARVAGWKGERDALAVARETSEGELEVRVLLGLDSALVAGGTISASGMFAVEGGIGEGDVFSSGVGQAEVVERGGGQEIHGTLRVGSANVSFQLERPQGNFAEPFSGSYLFEFQGGPSLCGCGSEALISISVDNKGVGISGEASDVAMSGEALGKIGVGEALVSPAGRVRISGSYTSNGDGALDAESIILDGLLVVSGDRVTGAGTTGVGFNGQGPSIISGDWEASLQ